MPDTGAFNAMLDALQRKHLETPAPEVAELCKQIEALETCNREHLARIGRLNALLVRYEREADKAEATNIRLEAERVKGLREVFECDTIIAVRNATIIRLQAELAESRAQYDQREHDLPY